MKTLLNKTILAAALIGCSSSLFAQQLAFPGAEGWGRWAKGARASQNPTVYHVTNLNDSGSGSLRDAVSQPNRVVVFDVSGIIHIQSRIVFASNLYVAGQTAPGEGVTVYGDGVSFSNSSNIICRYLRVRMGHGGSSGKDCAGVAEGRNMIFDHCSFSWGLDETFSINGFGKAYNITLQNSIIGQGLMTHSAGGLMQADSITLYRNLYIDNSTRNNKVKGTNQYANNVVYNWQNGCYIMGGDSEGESWVNIESNLFINGPSGGGDCFGGANQGFHCYGVDNWQDKNKDGQYNPYEVTNYSASDHRSTDPYDYPVLPLYPGNELIERNIPTVGASLPYRDQSDCYMIDELMSMGKKGALISNEESLPIGGPLTWDWWQGEKRTDTDGDGMPDEWELANGTNINVNDATVIAQNGYLNIENYINSITQADSQFFLRRPITLTAASTTSTLTLTWRDYTEGEDGFMVAYCKEGEPWRQELEVPANATNCTLTDLEPGTSYLVTVRAWKSYVPDVDDPLSGLRHTSDYTSGTFKTKPIEVGMVDIDSYQPDITNTSEDADGKKLLLHSDETLDFTLDSNITPSAVVATGRGLITVNGSGSIGGENTSMNKGGEGTLALNNKNNYTGATVLHQGVLEFNSIANGGEASAIGASQEFAQNWVMDGGTYRYTGPSAQTNRSARLSGSTTLEVAEGKTLTMNGSIEGYGDEPADLTLDGAGQLTVGTTSFFGYRGKTILRGGTLYLSTTDISKQGIGQSAQLVLAGGTLKTRGESSNYETYSFPVEVTENTYSIIAPNRNCYFKSKLTGAGTLEYQIPYLREYFNADVSDFKGKIVANGLSSDASGAMFMCEGSNFNMPTTQVTLKGNAHMAIWGTNGNGNIGGLSGESTTSLCGSSKNTKGFTCNWTIGGANSDEEFLGVINSLPAGQNSAYKGTVNITKVGTGAWRLSGQNVYAGSTTVKGGELIVNGSHNWGTTYTVGSEATLKGTGKIMAGDITIQAGGQLYAGDTLVINKQFNLEGTHVKILSEGMLTVPVSSLGTSVKSNSFKLSNLTLSDGAILKVDMSNVPNGLANDTRIQVLASWAEIDGRFDHVEPLAPGEGQEWDLSELYSDGYIYVREEGYNAHRPVYEEQNLFAPTGMIDTGGYYYFTSANTDYTQQYIDLGIIDLGENGKATMADSYATDQQTGALKLSKGAEVIFAPGGDVASLKLALYRASGTDWGSVYGSEDGEEWVLIATLNSTDLIGKQTNYLDLTIEQMRKRHYNYIKVSQLNGASPTYLSGIALTYMQATSAIETIGADSPHTHQRYDLLGRPAKAAAHNQLLIKGTE